MVECLASGAVTFEGAGAAEGAEGAKGAGFKGNVTSFKNSEGEDTQLPSDLKLEIQFQDGSTVLLSPGELFTGKNGMDDIKDVKLLFNLENLEEGMVNTEFSFLKNLESRLTTSASSKSEMTPVKMEPGVDIIMLFTMLMSTLIAVQANTQRLLSMHSQTSIEETFNLAMKSADKKVLAAEKKRDAAVTQAICEMIAGGVQAVASCAAMGNSENGQAINGLGQGLSQLITGFGKYLSAGTQFESDIANVEAERLQASASMLQSFNQNMGGSISNVQQSITSLLQAFKAFLDIINQTNMTLASAVGGR
ncbi:MAG: hypothetical protein LBI69_04290 [Puniceicoccales bacterium]|jgi:hypothetical protein|nr:hypothetical protein [Puniceicoccales bacterium]